MVIELPLHLAFFQPAFPLSTSLPFKCIAVLFLHSSSGLSGLYGFAALLTFVLGVF